WIDICRNGDQTHRNGDPGAKRRNVELHEFATSDALLQPGRVASTMRRVDSPFGLAQLYYVVAAVAPIREVSTSVSTPAR
ncbi:MAG: hypothetical protein QOH69_1656, partial [Actinomycetota bacterium]|nr:hypothetical protein [Actinomycetota bacterium]